MKPRKTFHFAAAATRKTNHGATAPTEKLVSKLSNSLWSNSLNRYEFKESYKDEFDVAIIGGGFSGLWTAFHLLQINSNLRIAIFEARHFGFGASGRNGGWASSDYPVYRSTLEKRVGKSKTDKLFKSLSHAIDEIGQFAGKYAPESHFIKSGTIMFATNPAQEKRLRAAADSEHAWYSKEKLAELVKVANARGGLFNPECATVNPGGLLTGLVNYLINQKVSLYENSFATPVSNGVLVNSALVRVKAVIHATEVFGEPGRDFIPLYSQMVATQPIPQGIWDEIGVKERFTFAEGSHLINYAQRTADNRLAIGGRGATYPFQSKLAAHKEMTESVHENIRKLARKWFPQLVNVEFTHAWGGAVAITRNWEPYVQFDARQGFGRLGGYAGDGVTMSFLAAKIMAALVMEQESELTKLHFVNREIRKWEPEPLRYFAVNTLVKLSGVADREEQLTRRPSVLSRVIAPLILR